MTLTDILYCIGEGLGIAAATLTGQNLGARRPDLSFLYSRIGLRFTVVLSMGLGALLFAFRASVMGIYSDDAEVIRQGANVLLVISSTSLFVMANSLYAGALRGAGDVNFVGVSSLIGFFLARPVVSYVLCYPLGVGLVGAWIGLAVDYVVRFILYYIRFNRGKWTKIRV